MIGNKTVLAIIPARGGSKGVPRKNIRLLGGKPLIAWSIEEAKKSKYIDHLILSSEDDEIISVAKQYGCDVPFKRPTELASDDTAGIEPVIHALNQLKAYDYVVLLQPTSPLRTVEDIDQAIEQSIKSGKSCVSVTEASQSPFWMYMLDPDLSLKYVIEQQNIPLRRQEAKSVYVLNGAVYVSSCENIIKNKSFLMNDTVGYVMSREKSIDIDDEIDFQICEIWLKQNRV